jgi:NDP-sugar pyrophosphorylase family protein
MKIRVSLSLDEEVLKEIDSEVDGINIRSRSDAAEKMFRAQLAGRKKAVILCGGRPEKLFIPELKTYRPLVSIGKTTLIEYIVSKCREIGFKDVIIIGSSTIVSKIYEVLVSGGNFGVNITYVEEQKELGSAKTLELAKNYLNSDFLFLPCDHYFDFDLKDLYEFHMFHKGTVTLGIHTRTSFDWKSGIVEMNGYKIVDFEEHPKKPKTHLSSIFIGFMKKDIFDNIPPGDVYWSLQENIFPKLAKAGKLVGYPIAGNWVNIHSKEDVEKARNMNKYLRSVK